MRIHSILAVGSLLLFGAGFSRAQDQGSFPDVPRDHWASAAVAHLKKLGILKGYPMTSESVEQLRDYEVLETVLTGLLRYQGTESPVNRSKRLWFDRAPADWRITDTEVLRQIYGVYGKSPDDSQRLAVTEAVLNLAARQSKPSNWLAQFTPHDKDILFYRKRASQDKGQKEGLEAYTEDLVHRLIRAWLPGYSRDGQMAIVHLSIPWSIHHAEGTFLLVRTSGRWEIVRRYFVYYV